MKVLKVKAVKAVKTAKKAVKKVKKPMLDKNKRLVCEGKRCHLLGCKLTLAEAKKFNAFAKKEKARKNEILRGLLLKAGLI